jgi:hypothetical protein
MTFSITPEFTDKVFLKLGKLAKTDLNFESNDSQVQLCRGFVDYLHKEANVSCDMALGIIESFCDKGAEWLSENYVMPKKDAQEGVMDSIGKAKDRLVQGVIDKTSPLWRPFVEPKMRSSMNDIANEKIQQVLGGAKQYGDKAWSYLKSPEFLTNVAPMLAGGLVGAFAPKAFGGGPIASGLGAAGGALLGRYVSENKDSITNSGRAALDSLRKQIADTFKSTPVNRQQ